MRIAMISAHATPGAGSGGTSGGTEAAERYRYVTELSAALTDIGHDVRVYTRRTDPDSPDQLRLPSGVVVEHLPAGPQAVLPGADAARFTGAFGERLGQRWHDDLWRPDLAHAHSSMSGMAALAARQQHPVPVVVTFHRPGVDQATTGAVGRPVNFERILGRQADRVIAQSVAEEQALLARGVPRQAINLVPSGIDTTLFHADGPAAPRGGDYRLVTVDRAASPDRLAELVGILRLLPDTELVVIGAESDDPAARARAGMLHEIAVRHRVADRLTITGAVPHVDRPRWYRSADLLAYAATEPDGRTALEAMACGLPVVGYATGAVIDTVVDGVTGSLVPRRDERTLARALRRLLRDPIRRMAFTSAAIDRARTCYPWRRTAEQLARVYADLRRAYTVRLAAGPVVGALLAG